MAKTFVGARLRALRRERGLSQAALATSLGISPSYLNQIEHDARPLTVPVLLRITEVFGVDTSFFNSQDSTRLIAELREVAMDSAIELSTDPAELDDLVAAHPDAARALVAMHRRYRSATEQLAQATDSRTGKLGPDGIENSFGAGTITMPHEEVRDYFYKHHNYFDALDRAAEDLTTRMRMHSADIRGQVIDRLQSLHGVSVARRVDLPEGTLHRFDPVRRVIELSGHLAAGQQVFKLASELAYLDCPDLINGLIDDPDLTSPESRSLARFGLANYYAAAVVLPYRQFHGAAEEYGYDIERLSAFYSVSYESIAHRLSTMQRPGERGVPFTFVRVDRAGNMSKRQSATGFHFPASGGTCPLWSVYETFAYPGKIVTQIAEMPDGRNYLWVSRTVERRATRYGQPSKTFAIGVGCELRHAHRLIYARGLDISESAVATPIGAGCRVCEREQCPQRAFPMIGRELDINEHRSTISPYLVR